MNPFPDTSFLYAVYRSESNSRLADKVLTSLDGSLPVTTLLLLEFRQSVRFQCWINSRDTARGFSAKQGEGMLKDLQSDLASGLLEILPVDWANAHHLAEILSARHTVASGHRLVDILHVATALELGAREFLTFDVNQMQLAKSEGLTVRS